MDTLSVAFFSSPLRGLWVSEGREADEAGSIQVRARPTFRAAGIKECIRSGSRSIARIGREPKLRGEKVWEYKPPTNLDLANFLSIYSVQHPHLRHLKTTPVLIERMIGSDPIFRALALNIHRKFCDEMGQEIEKMMRGELQCSYIYPSGKECPNFNEPGNYRCRRHRDR
jgi:hypothetical protein